MHKYDGSAHGSGILAYEVGRDSIRIKFVDGSVYLYTYGSTGPRNIDAMKSLAEKGDGLNTYINRYVRRAYDRREL